MERARSGPQARVMPLATMKELLRRLAHPEKGRGTVHITGSKGKGSTSLYIAALLTGSHITNSLYTSPHLHSYTERILSNLQPIPEPDLAGSITAVKPAVDFLNARANVGASDEAGGGPVSTFGAITAAFFDFTRQKCLDWQVVEVGLGGGQDATNVFEQKDLSVITPVSLEHTAILGSTCAEIMKMKAQIITPGSVAVIADQQDREALEVVAEHCAEVGAELLYVPELYRLEVINGGADFQQVKICRVNDKDQLGARRYSNYRRNYNCEQTDNVFLRARGAHQARNFVTALAAFDNLLARGLIAAERRQAIELASQVVLPGRCESIVFSGHEFILDGAHNGESAAVLSRTLQQQLKLPLLGFIVGCNNDKNIEDIVKALSPVCKWLIATRSSHAKSMDPGIIAAACAKQGIECVVSNDWQESIGFALERTGAHQPVGVAGSLYLIADVRKYLLAPDLPANGNSLSWSVLPDRSLIT